MLMRSGLVGFLSVFLLGVSWAGYAGEGGSSNLVVLNSMGEHQQAVASKPDKPPVFVIVNVMSQERLSGKAVERRGEFFVNALSESYPDAKFIVVDAATNSDVRYQLDQLVEPTDRVQGLYVYSHGAPLVVGSSDGQFSVKLAQPESVKAVFAPLLGKFVSDAMIIFDACDTIKGGNEKDKIAGMASVSRAFGLKTGYIFMSSIYASNAVEDVVVTPTSQLKSESNIRWNYRAKTWSIVKNFLPLLGVAGAMVTDRVFNRGFVLEVDDTEYRMYRENKFSADGSVSSGRIDSRRPVQVLAKH